MTDHVIGHSLKTVRLSLSPGTCFPEHQHQQEHELILTLKGCMQTEMAGCTYRNPPGTLLYHPARMAHAELVVGARNCEFQYLSWTDDDAITIPLLPHFTMDSSGRIQSLVEWLVRLDAEREAQGALRLSLFQSILLSLRASKDEHENGLVHAIREHIRANLSGSIRLDDLASLVDVSKFHLVRIFSRATGLTPMAYVARMRVEAARSLLVMTGLPLRMIASQVGFTNEFTLSRAVKRLSGRSPRSIRAAARDRQHREVPLQSR